MKYYTIAKKDNFLSDYSCHKKYKLDLSVSGKMLVKYPCSIKLAGLLNKLDCYVDNDEENKLLERLAKKYTINKSNLILGSGANGLLQNIVKILFDKPGYNLVTPFYTFQQVVYGVHSFGGEVRLARMGESFNISIHHIQKSVDRNTKMIFLCNPNNPTGRVINPEEIIELAQKVKAYVVVSEAAIEFSSTKSLLDFPLPSNVIVIRSFSKEFGLAGIRLGFAYVSAEFKSKYFELTPTNQVGNATLLIANYALTKEKIINKNIKRVLFEKEYLQKKLANMNIPFIISHSNTVMVCKNINTIIPRVLEKQQFKVTTITGENGEQFIRIAIGPKKTNRLFIKKLMQLKEVYDENFFSN